MPHTDPADANVALLIGEFYSVAPPPLRVRLLNNLLLPLGPLALVTIGAGAFGRLLPSDERWHGAHATLDDATHFSADEVQDLVRYVQQKSPELLRQLPERMGENRV